MIEVVVEIQLSFQSSQSSQSFLQSEEAKSAEQARMEVDLSRLQQLS